jgi:hypothetical protein
MAVSSPGIPAMRGAAGTAGRGCFRAVFRARLADREDLLEAFFALADFFFAAFRLGAAFFRPARAAFFLRFAIAILLVKGREYT